MSAGADGKNLVETALAHPLGSPCLGEIIRQKQARNAVVVVNDITRPTPYEVMLPPLLAEIEAAGIKPDQIELIVATGIHRPHTEDNRAVFGEELCRRYRIVNHDCDHNLKLLGQLSNGLELVINRTAAEADLLVTTGVVGLHYFAGYSGGRKSILPGIASRPVIEANHRMMIDPRACLGNYRDNPVSDLMLEAAYRAGVDFILNVVTRSKHDIAFCAAGEVRQAWMAAVEFCEEMTTISITARADIVVARRGGYPKDINMYQAQKALDAALWPSNRGDHYPGRRVRRRAGRGCLPGLDRYRYLPSGHNRSFPSPLPAGGHKAYAICRTAEQADIILVSSLNEDQVHRLFMTPADSLHSKPCKQRSFGTAGEPP